MTINVIPYLAAFMLYMARIGAADPVWQEGFHDFNVYKASKVEEKLRYMHENPVKARLVESAEEWGCSSARWYRSRQPVGVPIGLPESRLSC